MNHKHPSAKCYRQHGGKQCRQPRSAHVDGLCPDGSGKTWMGSSSTKSTRQSTSFTAAEASALAFICERLQAGLDVTLVTKAPAFATLANKAVAMAERARGAKDAAE